MTGERARTILAVAATAAMLAGCRPCPKELIGREALFAGYNGNAAKAPGLRANADIEIQMAGQLLKARLTDGRLYFRRGAEGPAGPHYFLLRGKEVGQTFFELGVDPEAREFYCWVRPPRGRGFARWGRIEDLRRPGWETLPIDPEQLLSTLGIVGWPTDLDGPTQVILKTPDTSCAYVMSVVARRPEWGGWYLQREEWLDRRETPCRPRRISLFNRQGQSVMNAELDRYEPIAVDDGDAPVMPTDIKIQWPKGEQIRSIRVRLSAQAVIAADAATPPPAAFRRRIPADIEDARPLRPLARVSLDVSRGADE